MGDEYVLDTPTVRAFVSDVRAAIDGAPSPELLGSAAGQSPAARLGRPTPEEACDAIRPSFAELLADPQWLPADFQAAVPGSGMGGGIGQWLLYRTGDGSLSLFSLVVPAGSATPVHDHLAWGLVGLYRGTQEEEVFVHEQGELRLAERRSLGPGDFYALLPPRDDIHRVRTTSEGSSVSIHLLTNDTGCTWRHTFEPGTGEVRPFRSGYANAPCDPAERANEAH